MARFGKYGTLVEDAAPGAKAPRFGKFGTLVNEEDEASSTLSIDDVAPRPLSLEEIDKTVREDRGGSAIDFARSGAAGAVKGIGSSVRGLGDFYQAAGRSLYRPFEMALRESGLDDVADAFNTPIPAWVDPGEIIKRPGQVIEGAGEKIAVPEERQTFATQTGEGLGQIAGQLTAAILTGGASSEVSMALLLGQGTAQMEDMRKQYAPNKQDAMTDAALIGGGAITALLEETGLENILERMPPNIRNGAVRQIADIAIAGGYEAAQEVAEGVLQRLTAMAAFSPDIKLFEETPDEAAVGGSVGAIARGLLNIAMPGRLRTPTENAAQSFMDNIENAQWDQDGASVAVRQMDPKRAQQILTKEELDAEIPNDLLIEGKQLTAQADADDAFESLLDEQGLGGIGSRVSVDFGDGRVESGEILGGFDADSADLGVKGRGISIKLDNGNQIDELLETLQSIGVKITPEIQQQVQQAVGTAKQVQSGGGVLPAAAGQAAPGAVPSSPSGAANAPSIGTAEAGAVPPDGPAGVAAAAGPPAAAPTMAQGRPTAPVQGLAAGGSEGAGAGATAPGAQNPAVGGQSKGRAAAAGIAGGQGTPTEGDQPGPTAAARDDNAAGAKKVPSVSKERADELAQKIAGKLRGRPASWVIREKATGAVIMETADQAKVDALNTAKYEAVPIQEHLASLNRPSATAPAPEKPKSDILLRESDNKPWPTKEAAREAAKGKKFRKKRGRGWIPTKVEGGYGLKLRTTVKGARKQGPRSAENTDILTFIASHGGIDSAEGDDVKGFKKMTQAGPLVRKGGRKWDGNDGIVRLLRDNEYFPGENDPSVEEVKRVLADAIRHKKKIYRPDKQGEIEAENREAQDAAEEADARAAILAEAEESGITFSETDVAGILGLMGERGLGVQAAIDAWADEAGVDTAIELEQATGDEDYGDIPFEPIEAGGEAREGVEGQTRPGDAATESKTARGPPAQPGEPQLKRKHAAEDVAIARQLAADYLAYVRGLQDGSWDNWDVDPRADWESFIEAYRAEHGDGPADDLNRLGADARKIDKQLDDDVDLDKLAEREKEAQKAEERRAELRAEQKAAESTPTTLEEWVDHLAAKIRQDLDRVFTFKAYGGEERAKGWDISRSKDKPALIAKIQGRRKRLKASQMDAIAKQLGTVRLKKIRDAERAATTTDDELGPAFEGRDDYATPEARAIQARREAADIVNRGTIPLSHTIDYGNFYGPGAHYGTKRGGAGETRTVPSSRAVVTYLVGEDYEVHSFSLKELKAAPTFEEVDTVDGKRDQAVIAGAEQDAAGAQKAAETKERALARLKGAQKKMRAGKAQEDPGGMFAPKQEDLLSGPPASDYGANNKLVSKDRADELARKLAAKFKGQLNTGIDPEMMAMGAELAIYHIEAGARRFVDFARKLRSQLEGLGVAWPQIKPYLRGWYNGARDMIEDKGGDITGMDEGDAVRAAMKDIDSASAASSGVESDSRDAASQDELGETDVPVQSSGTGSRPGSRGGAAGERGGDVAGGASVVPGAGAAPVGETGNRELRASKPAVPRGASERDGRDGGGADGEQGSRDDAARESAAKTAAPPAQGLEAAIAAQKAAMGEKIVPADKANIDKTLPFLREHQREDVLKAETRLYSPNGFGYLFTNGTGTGKTYVAGGLAARFWRSGERNILVVVPSQDMANVAANALRNHLQIPAGVLEDKSTNKTAGVVATTYANFQDNPTLADRTWDLVIFDESQKIMSSENSELTLAAKMMRANTNHPDGLYDRARMQLRKEWEPIEAAMSLARLDRRDFTPDEEAAYRAMEDKTRALADKLKGEKRSRVVFLSATPFAYTFNVDYAQGYLFDWHAGAGDDNRQGYNAGSNRDRFYMQHFGYRMRYNKLTKPDASVDTGVMERQFNQWLKDQGVLSGRRLEVPFDYDRKFVLVDDAIGNTIDKLLDALSDNPRWSGLGDRVRKRFDYLARVRLLEAIKANHAVPYIKAQHALGRKVVVFHDFNEGGGFNPFEFEFDDTETVTFWDGKTSQSVKLKEIYEEFHAAHPEAHEMKFADLGSPLATLQRAFPGALVYNGTVPNKQREEAKRLFNTDGNASNLIIVQSAAGEFGISLHDTTGKHQRVLVNLGMPTRPVTAIQEEGRIYRDGQASDAIFRYFNTGTNWERFAFATKISERASTAENLALGNEARALRDAFVNAFLDSAPDQPGAGDGKGGKEADKAANAALSEWDRAKTFYYAQQKQRGKRTQREGIDYFPTPEPVGLKMVQLLGLDVGEKALEPSAGHGAVARFLPEHTDRTLIEPSNELSSRAGLVTPGAKVITDRFENLHLTNKYDGIVMNPPYGVGGKTAMEHVTKAIKHLRNGGRVVALIPTGGMADRRFDEMMDSEDAKGVYLVADIKLPQVTFAKAGTGVMTRIVVLEKQTDADVAAKIRQTDRDYTNVETIAELFDRMENLEIRPRLEPKTKDVETTADADGNITLRGIAYKLTEDDSAFRAKPTGKMGPDAFRSAAQRAGDAGGMYVRGAGYFSFPTKEARDTWAAAMAQPDPEPAAAPAGEGVAPGVKFVTGEVVHAKKNIPLYVAQIEDRVERPVYDAINRIAKKHGGYYSAFKGRGAMPGFQFESEAKRAAFLAEAGKAKDSRQRAPSVLYHVTFTDRMAKIRKAGLSPFGDGSSNWTKGGKRYQSEPRVYVFDNARAALRWAKKMEYEFAGKKGAADVTILKIRRSDGWETDTSADPMLALHGKALQRAQAVPPGDILDSVRLGDLPTPADTGESFDDWLESQAGRLESTAKESRGLIDFAGNFFKWFGNSKVVDEDGGPLVVYHGTENLFNRFDTAFAGDSREAGHFFTTNPDLARQYGSEIIGAYLKIENPYTVSELDWNLGDGLSFEEARAAGHDGYIITGQDGGDTYVVFEPTQIKSTENNGNWDGTNPNIREARDVPLRGPVKGGPPVNLEQLQARLKEVGLADKVVAKIVKQLKNDAAGNYLLRMIWISQRAQEGMWTFNHELVHAFRDMGLIHESEWLMLKNMVLANRDLMADIKERYPDLTEEEQIEEAIADLFAAWKAGKPPQGRLERLLAKIEAFFKAIAASWRGEYNNPIDLMEAMDRGYIGRRDATEYTPSTKEKEMAAAYHGTPHDFDEFDLSKIGTGEGAQAYGWGLYFAGNRAIAEHYRRKLSGREQPYFKGEKVDRGTFLGQAILTLVSDTKKVGFEDARDDVVADLHARLRGQVNAGRFALDEKGLAELRDAIGIMEQADEGDATVGAGRLFTVDLQPAEDEYLLWDKPLSEQSEKVRAAIDAIPQEVWDAIDEKLENAGQNGMSELKDEYTGAQLYRVLSAYDIGEVLPPELPGSSWYEGNTSDKQHASMYLKSLGIRGVKYRDSNSRQDEPAIDKWVADEGGLEPALQRIRENIERLGPTSDASRHWRRLLKYLTTEPQFNYVIFDAADVKVTAKESRGNPRIQGNLSQETAINKAIVEEKQGGIVAAVKEAYAAFRAQDKTEWLWASADEFAGLRALGQELNPGARDRELGSYVAARLSRHSAGQIEAFLKHGAPVWDAADQSLGISSSVPGLYKLVEPLFKSGKARLFEGYAYARRVSSQNLIADGREHNLTDIDVQELLQLGQQHPEFVDIFDKVQAFKKATLDAAEAMGLVNAQQRATWEQADHIPFYRAVEEDERKSPRAAKGLAGQSPQIRRLTGGDKRYVVVENATGRVVDRFEGRLKANQLRRKLGQNTHSVQEAGQPIIGVIENLAQNITHLINASIRNHAAVMAIDEALAAGWAKKVPLERARALVPIQAMIRALEGKNLTIGNKQGIGGIMAITAIQPPVHPGNGIIAIRRQGQVEYYEVDDKLVYSALAGLYRGAHHPIIRFFGAFKNMLTRGVTAMPDFMVRNMVRDTSAAWIQSEERGFNIFKEAGKTLRALVTRLDDPRVKAIMAAGGDTGWYQNAPEDVVSQLRKLERTDRIGWLNYANPLQLFKVLERLGRASEIANRIVQYDETLKATGSRRQAAFDAADLMDFQLKGGSDFMLGLTAIVPFLNARIQGLYKLGRYAAQKKSRKSLLAKAGIIMAFSTALALINAGDDDDDGYNDLPEYVKDSSWAIPVYRIFGKKIADQVGLPRFLLIPKPFELGTLFGTVPERIVQGIAGNDSRDATLEAVTRAVLSTFAFNPAGNPITMEILQQWANKDVFRGEPIVGTYQQYLPAEDQYNAGTTQSAKGVGRIFGVSPARLEHAVRGFTGTAGMWFLEASDVVAEKFGITPPSASLRLDEAEILRSFASGSPVRNSKWVDEFYNLRDTAEGIAQSIRQRRQNRDTEGANELFEENRGLVVRGSRGGVAMAPGLDADADRLARITRQMKDIRQSEDMTPAQKREELDRLIARRNEIAKARVKKWLEQANR